MKYPMRLEDLIYVIPNAMDYICDTLIEHHTKMCNRGLGIDIDKKDDKMGIDIKISTDVLYEHHGYPEVIDYLNELIKEHFDERDLVLLDNGESDTTQSSRPNLNG